MPSICTYDICTDYMCWSGLFTCSSLPPDYEAFESKDLDIFISVPQSPLMQEPSACLLNYALVVTLWFDMAAGFVSRNQLG